MSCSLTSTTAPGKVFSSRLELAEHYKSEWHRYNLKRREAGLPLLREEDFQARLQAALALRRERESSQQRSGTSHLKTNKARKKNAKMKPSDDGIQQENDNAQNEEKNEFDQKEQERDEATASMQEQEEVPVIEPRQSLFDNHISPSVQANLSYMQQEYGFFLPDQEYLVDMEGLIGYCHEKIKLGHYCLYCQRIFSTWVGCQKHMISTRHTKLQYEAGVDLEEFEPFYDFSEANEDFLGEKEEMTSEKEEQEAMDDDADGWEDVSDDEEEAAMNVDNEDNDKEEMMEDDEGMYAGYQDEIAKYGFDVTPLGELVFPDGRIVGHRGLARYYKQRLNPNRDTAAVVAARHAAGERMHNGRVYNINRREEHKESALTFSRAGVAAGSTVGQGSGVLVPTKGGSGFTALSLYRYRAVVKKARREDARGQRLQNKTRQNINRMDKKANRLMNNQSVPHAKR
jgi:pre-60S factor REI1